MRGCMLDSTTVPVAALEGFADSCSNSATRRMVSNRSSIPNPFLALICKIQETFEYSHKLD